MDTQALLIGFIMLIVCIVPIFILIKAGSKSTKIYVEALNEMAKNNNTDVAEFDHWNDKAIGMNTSKNQVFYVRKKDFNEENFHINLADIQKCKVVVTNRDSINKDEKANGIARIELCFIHSDKRKQDINIEFFHIDHGSLSMEEEQLLAEKWNRMVNENLVVMVV